MSGRRLWCKFQANGGLIRVYVNLKELELDGVKVDAYYDPDKGTIEVHWIENEARMKQTLLHELFHVFFRGCSGDLREKVLGPKTVEGRHSREEMIVSYLEPVAFDIMTRAGWLKLPRPPRFTKVKE